MPSSAPRNGSRSFAACPTGAGSEWRAACTSAAPTIASTRTRCRSRASSSSSIGVEGPRCSAAHRTSGKESRATKEAFGLAESRHGPLGSVGWCQSPKLGGDYRGGTIGASPAYSFTAHAVELVCDCETGRIEVEKIWIAHDCGRALNPVAVEGQMEGSAYMGFAEALMEEQVFKPASAA